MPNKSVVLNGYAFTDECVTLYLAVLTDRCPFLYFYKGPNFCVVPNLAAVEIDEVLDADVLTEFDVRCDLFHDVSPSSR